MDEVPDEITAVDNLEKQEIEMPTTNGSPETAMDDVNADALDNSSHQANGNFDANNDPIDKDNCLLRLVFRDDSTFEELHQLIGKCVRDALFVVKKSANVIVDKDENSVKIIEISAENNDNMFMVDTLPTENMNESEIPDYDSSVIDVLNSESPVVKQTDADESNKPKGNCWNCGGDHNLRDCTEKRDAAAIQRAKQTFMQKTRTERYHLDAEQKYNHLMPGQISENLRQALGLRSRELPLFIYKMRLYGYPAGWLEEAKINHSGLSLFHSENSTAADNGLDDGEIDKVEFDASKFIEYPGFNAPTPMNLIDEGDYYRVPPIQFSHSKEGLTQLLQNNLAKKYKRKRLKLDVDEEPSSSNDNVKQDDMDIQGSDDEPMLFPQPRPEPPASPDAEEPNSNNPPDDELSANCDSTQLSLMELKRKQEEILKALEDASSDSNSNPASPDQNGEQNVADTQTNNATKSIEMNIEEKITEESMLETTANASEITETTEATETAQQTETVFGTPKMGGRSREKVEGTPLIKQVSPYSKLPVGDKWSVGVTDVIDFENLPESTGKYQKLNGLIQKVRTIVKEINEENERSSS